LNVASKTKVASTYRRRFPDIEIPASFAKLARKLYSLEKKTPQDFKSVAKALGCDDDKARFEAKLGKIAKKPSTAKS
jgi:hypothetical protein